KGKLLEQLTGTEIYGQISRKVFERHSEEKAKLERIVVELGAIQVLSVEEVAQVQQEMERLQQEQIQVSKILDQLDTASTWLCQIKELKKQIDELHVQLPQLKEQHEAALKDVYDAQQLWEAAQEQKPASLLFSIKYAVSTRNSRIEEGKCLGSNNKWKLHRKKR